jgi:tyrosyl-tRNA synthetase
MERIADKKTAQTGLSEALGRYADKVYPSKEALESALSSGKRLKIYLGVDPTGPHIHLGHATNLLLLKALQNAGHEIIFLIGDFTARIGDPTDKFAARQPLTEKQIAENLKTFKEQAGKIISFTGKNPAKVDFNSKWLAKMNLSDIVKLFHHVTVQQLIERDMFQERMRAGKPIGLHEFLYPLMQGYDSVAMKVDAEVGGSDQTFNMLMGRTLARIYLNKEKFVITTPLLVNPKTGKKIMNKSEGGLINLDDSADDMFGKVMAIGDDTMFQLAKLSTEMPLAEIEKLEKAVSRHEMNPKNAKERIAKAVVSLVWGEKTAQKAAEKWEELFSKKEMPTDLPALQLKKNKMSVLEIVLASGAVKSRGEARRLITQGGFSVNGVVKNDPNEILSLSGGEAIKIGKKNFFRIKI